MSQLRRLWHRYHPIVWWVVLIKAMFGLSFTLLVPMYRGPDEPHHVDMIRWHETHTGYPDPTERIPWSPGMVVSERLVSPGGSPRPPQHTADAVPRPDRLPFAELGDPLVPRERGNHMSQHPPLYYVTAAVASSVTDVGPPDLWTWDREVYLYRLVSWLSVLALPLLAAEAALAVGLARAFNAVAAAFTLLVPMSTFIGAVANNDGMAFAFAWLAVVGALGYLRRGGHRWALMTAVGCAGAPLTKSTAAPVVAWALIVVAVAVVRSGVWQAPGAAVRSGGWRPPVAVLRHAALVVVGALVGFSWHLINVVRFGDPQPNSFGPRPNLAEDASIVDYLPTWVARVSSTFWGQPARRTGVTLAPWMITVLTVAAIALCLYALVSARRIRWPVGLLSLLVAGQVALLFRTNWKSHVQAGTFQGLQGRYLYALLVPLAALTTVAVAALLRRLRDRRHGTAAGAGQPTARLAAGIAAGVATAGIGLHAFLGWSMLTGGYWAADGEGVRGQVRAVVAWSPLPAALTLATFVATALAVALAGAWVVLNARSARSARAAHAAHDPTTIDLAEAAPR